jgi:hypothetical protein
LDVLIGTSEVDEVINPKQIGMGLCRPLVSNLLMELADCLVTASRTPFVV